MDDFGLFEFADREELAKAYEEAGFSEDIVIPTDPDTGERIDLYEGGEA